MAQAATGFGKKSARAATPAETPPRAEATPRESSARQAPERAALRAIPLDLAPLAARFEAHRSLSVRIERLHHLGHLSKGRNNGDNSWSLVPDDLHDLSYMLPETVQTAHTLAVRIIDLGGGGSTLTVLDVPVTPGPSPLVSVPWDTARTTDTANGTAEGEDAKEALRQLEAGRADRKPGQDGYASLDSTLVIRRDKLWGGAAAPAAAPGRMLAEKGEAEPSMRTVDGSTPSTDYETELRQLRERCDSLEAALAQRNDVLVQMRTAAEQARDHAKWEQEQALAQSERRWRVSEEERLSATEAQWRQRLTKLEAELRSSTHATRDEHEKELRRLREQCASLETALSARDMEGAELRRAVESARDTALKEAERILAEAKTAWTDAEGARLAAAQAKWRDSIERAAQSERQEAGEALRRLRGECAALQAALAERETGLGEAKAAVDAARERALAEAERVLADAKNTWAAEEAAHLAAAEAKWLAESAASAAPGVSAEELASLRDANRTMQAALTAREAELAASRRAVTETQTAAQRDAEQAVAEARRTWEGAEAARLAAAEAQWRKAATQTQSAHGKTAAELQHLSEQCAVLQQGIAARDSELAQLRKDTEGARAAWRESRDALAQAEKVWRADEAARLAAAEKDWRKTYARELSEANTRAETAETALSQLRRTQVVRAGRDEEMTRLRDELAETQSALAGREAELLEMRAGPSAAGNTASSTRIVLRRNREWEAMEPAAPERSRRPILRDMLIAACLAGAGIFFYPNIAPYLPEAMRPSLPATATPAPAAAAAAAAAAATAPQLPKATITQGVNFRAAPSTSSNVISTLTRGTEVGIVERQGNWSHIRVAGTATTPAVDGWVYTSFLNELP